MTINLEILACPTCHHNLVAKGPTLCCDRCGKSFPIVHDIPVFLPGPVAIVPLEYESNALGPQFEEILERGEGLTLHLGAGASGRRHPNCVELEHKIFRHTDVVGDAQTLPFRAAIFDRVFAFNVFERLRGRPRHPAGKWRAGRRDARTIGGFLAAKAANAVFRNAP